MGYNFTLFYNTNILPNNHVPWRKIDDIIEKSDIDIYMLVLETEQ